MRRWRDQAKNDLRWAEHLRDAGGYHVACVLAQQVAEKAPKALLYHHGAAAGASRADTGVARV